LKLIVAGHSNKVIARSCNLAESTVKIHLKAILRKICVRNRTQAAIWAVQHSGCGDLHEQVPPLSPEQVTCRPIEMESVSHTSTTVIGLTGGLSEKTPSRR
jgi:hypothetical protein